MNRLLALLLPLLAITAILFSLWQLRAATAGLDIRTQVVGDTPATVFRPASGPAGPVVVVAHGFAGSQQLMRSFATTLARNGYVAVTFDFSGHGRHPRPLGGSITEASGATRTLVEEVGAVAAHARPLGDGQLAVLGHSMASDIVVRYAAAHPEVGATVAVSMFSTAVTPTDPKNLLVIVGDWEGMLKREALKAVGLSAGGEASPGQTYGSFAEGTARRAAFSAGVEHLSVLYSKASLREAVAWLDQAFAVVRPAPPVIDGQGPWIVLLIAGAILLGRTLAGFLPVVADPPVGAALGWRRLAPVLLIPAVATPLLLRVVPTHVLPVLVADYLAAHFFTYGLISAAALAWFRRGAPRPERGRVSRPALAVAMAAVVAAYGVGLAWPIDSFATSFVAGPGRLLIVAAMLAGTLPYCLVDAWVTRGPGAPRGAAVASKAAFLVSLALAVALDFRRLFFLIIIVPEILVFFLAFGLLGAWIERRTGHPFAAAIPTAIAFAWAIGVTFPLLSG